jgi:hypothetical protein
MLPEPYDVGQPGKRLEGQPPELGHVAIAPAQPLPRVGDPSARLNVTRNCPVSPGSRLARRRFPNGARQLPSLDGVWT